MTDNNRFLVTTAIEETWKYDQPILFLGEWCKLYSKKENWKNLDFKVSVHHWDDIEKFHSDYKYLAELYEKILLDLSDKLNEIHGVDHNLRYWRILIGPWLAYIIQITFDRWATIQDTIKNYDINGTNILIQNEDELVPQNMIHLRKLMGSDEWNHYIYALILKNKSNVSITIVPSLPTNKDLVLNNDNNTFDKLVKIYSSLSKPLIKKNDAFIIQSYLSFYNNIALQIKLGQVPQLLGNISPIESLVLNYRRQWSLLRNYLNPYEEFLINLIPHQIPSIYLEGYSKIIDQVSSLNYPQKPKFIFTSTSLWFDDVIKEYVAQKVELGSPLFYGQHGGGYGQVLFMWAEEHERKIADKYLTWGWEEKNDKDEAVTIGVGVLRKIKKRRLSNYKVYDIMLVLATDRRYYTHLCSTYLYKYIDNFYNSIEFINQLQGNDLYNNLLIRMYHTDYGWEEKKRLTDLHPNIRIDDATQSIWKLVENTRLVVYSYNSTGYLEFMAANIPTIIFWDPTINPIRNSATKYFDDLKRVGIYHESPESAARHVKTIYNDIDIWWNNEDLKIVLNQFLRKYCYSSYNLLNNLKNIFNG